MGYVKDDHGDRWLYEPWSAYWMHNLYKLPVTVRDAVRVHSDPVDVLRLASVANTPDKMLALLKQNKAPLMRERH